MFGLIQRIKYSLLSTTLSLVIAISNEALVCPEENVAVYGPDL